MPEMLPRYVIHFQDRGQDFLRWAVDHAGVVQASEPFQTHVWKGETINNLRELLAWQRVMDCNPALEVEHHPVYVYLRKQDDFSRSTTCILHPVIRVEVIYG